MSTIALAAPYAPRTRLRMTARGRKVLAALVALPVVVALGFVILSSGGALASADRAPSGVVFETVTVMPGDTLWSIAGDIAPDADPRDVVDAILRLNAMDSALLDAGQTIALPIEYAPAR